MLKIERVVNGTLLTHTRISLVTRNSKRQSVPLTILCTISFAANMCRIFSAIMRTFLLIFWILGLIIELGVKERTYWLSIDKCMQNMAKRAHIKFSLGIRGIMLKSINKKYTISQ